MIRVVVAGMLAVSVTSAPLRAQGVAFQAGHLFDAGGLSAYQLSWQHALLGPLGTQVGGILFSGPGSLERRFGLSLDATLFRGGADGVYMIGGVGGGMGSGGAEQFWRSWSAGLGVEFRPVGPISLGLEGRWRSLLPAHREGAELAVRFGADFGARSPRPAPGPAAPPLTLAAVSAGAPAEAMPDALVADIIRIAEAEVGRPYTFGGEGQNGEGFDCSGLIQYAYASVGISLPRRSVDQARAGREVPRSADALRPGDILTFAERGRRISHVGMYLGDGRFIHSASRGVLISALSDDDPYGRWWYRRWVGVRRVVDEAPLAVEAPRSATE